MKRTLQAALQYQDRRGPTVRLLCHGVERRQLQDGAVEPISVSTIESATHGLSYREPVSRKR